MEDYRVNNIEFRSETVQEILGEPPHWIIRRGIVVIMIVILTLIIGSCFYKYPDIIKASITITTVNPPIPIIAKTNGKVDCIFVTDRQMVSEGQIVGVIENPAKYKDVMLLKEKMENIKSILQTKHEITPISFDDNYQLGMIHNSYAAFVSQWQSYHTTLRLNYTGEQIHSLQEQILDYSTYLLQLKEQVQVYEKDLELCKKQFNRDSLLYTKGVLPCMNYENSKSDYLKQLYGFKGSLANLTNTRLKINQINQQIIEYKIKKSEQEESMIYTLREKFEILNSQIFTWEQTYLLKSSIEGRITFTNTWSVNQNITAGNIVFTIVPKKENKIIGKILIPVSGSGKVKIGQKVNIKLENYPYMEYGIIEGTIQNISLVPIVEQKGAYYIAEVPFQNRLITNYKTILPFHQEMQGIVEIITEDKRLIYRFIEPIIAIFKSTF